MYTKKKNLPMVLVRCNSYSNEKINKCRQRVRVRGNSH